MPFQIIRNDITRVTADAHVHRYRMSLIGADLRHVLIESIALLIISADDLLQIGHGNVMFSGSVDAIDQIRC